MSDKDSHWVAIGDGFLKIGHKPGGKKLPMRLLVEEKTSVSLN